MKRQPTGQITMSELSPELYEDIKKAYQEDVPDTYIPDITVEGKTLVNLLGRRGNPIYGVVPGEADGAYYGGTAAISSKGYFTFTVTQDTDLSATQNCGYYIDVEWGKYYICLSEIMCGENTGGSVFAAWYPEYIVGGKSAYAYSKTEFETTFQLFRCVKTGTIPCSNIFNGANVGDVNKFKNCRLYEISAELYSAINSDSSYNMKTLAKLFPYVDDVKYVVNPHIECNENLAGDVRYVIGSFDRNGTIVTSDTAEYAINEMSIPVEPNTDYTLSYEGVPAGWSVYGQLKNWTNVSKTFNTGDNTFINIWVTKADEATNDNAKIALEKLRTGEWKVVLVKGTIAKSYDKCHNSRIVFETKLYEGETISRRNDGTYVKNSEWGEIINPHLEFGIDLVVKHSDGYKSIYVSQSKFKDKLDQIIDHDHYFIDYSGKIIYETGKVTNKYGFTVDGLNTRLDIPNILTGWGDNYTPTGDEIRAFFLGWRMFQAGVGDSYYDGTGEKVWGKLWCGDGVKADSWNIVSLVSGSTATTCPTIMNNNGYRPYKLIYKKITTDIEEVKTHGSLVVRDGLDVKVSSGLVLGESRPNHLCTYSKTKTLINCAHGFLKARPYKILNIINDRGEIEPFSDRLHNFIYDTIWAYVEHGNSQAIIDYDERVMNYSVDYIMWDTVQSFTYTITSPQTTKEILEKTIEELSNTNKKLSMENRELKNKIENLPKVSNPNLLINGDFQVWQRGTSFSKTHNQYSADRWLVINHGSGLDTTTSAIVQKTADGIRLSSKATVYVPSLNYIEITQPIEAKLCGTYTLTVKAKGYGEFYNFIYYNTRTSYTDIPKHTLSDEYKIYKFTFTTDGTKRVEPTLRLNGNEDTVNQDIYLDIAWVKLEKGEVSSEFTPRLYNEELALCQRYYQNLQIDTGFKTSISNVTYLSIDNSILQTSVGAFMIIPYKEMRRIPTFKGFIRYRDVGEYDFSISSFPGAAAMGNGNLLGYNINSNNVELVLGKFTERSFTDGRVTAYIMLNGAGMEGTTKGLRAVCLDAEIY